MMDLTEASEASEGANILKWISQTFDMFHRFKNAKHSLQALLSGRLTEMYFWYKGSPRVLRLMSFISLQSLVGDSHIITAYRWPQPPQLPSPLQEADCKCVASWSPKLLSKKWHCCFFWQFQCQRCGPPGWRTMFATRFSQVNSSQSSVVITAFLKREKTQLYYASSAI